MTHYKKPIMAARFRGLLPVVIDVETTGLNPETDGLLEIAAVTLVMNEKGDLKKDLTYSYQIEPFLEARLDPESLAITKIDPDSPLRFSIPASQALHRLFRVVDDLVKRHNCHRAVLVGHNAWFDLAFIQAEAKRNPYLQNPFHSFTTLDTATLSALALGETVLARALKAANIYFDVNQAHSAIYDAEKTADLFCHIVNRMR